MPPKKTIIVDPDQLLSRIAALAAERAESITAELAQRDEGYRSGKLPWGGWHDGQQRLFRAERELREIGLRYDLDSFAGHWLTDSERVRYRQCLRRMEAAKLVDITGRKATHVFVTPAGHAHLAELERQRTRAAGRDLTAPPVTEAAVDG